MTETKSILCLSCSPSKGRNSDSMLDAFIKGASEVDGISIEKIYLNDIPFEHYGFDNKDGPLPHENEFKTLTDKVQCATGLVIATPTYNFSVPAQLKNFIDRIRFFALDFDKQTKLGQPVGRLGYLKPYFLVSGGTPTWVQKLFFFGHPPFWLRAVFLYYGATYVGALYSGDVETYKNQKILTNCKKRGKKYANKLVAERCEGILSRIFIRPAQKD